MEQYFVVDTGSGKEQLEFIIEREKTDGGEIFRLRDNHTSEVIITVVDDGDGIIFIKKMKRVMTYSEQYYLLILMDFMNRVQTMPMKYRFVKDTAL